MWELANILQPGAGGHCIAVDPWFIVHAGGETAREVNTEWAIEKIKNAALAYEVEKAKVAFKPDIDDLRESPALYIARRLKADVLAEYREFEIVDYKEALEQSNIVTFLVAHKET